MFCFKNWVKKKIEQIFDCMAFLTMIQLAQSKSIAMYNDTNLLHRSGTALQVVDELSDRGRLNFAVTSVLPVARRRSWSTRDMQCSRSCSPPSWRLHSYVMVATDSFTFKRA